MKMKKNITLAIVLSCITFSTYPTLSIAQEVETDDANNNDGKEEIVVTADRIRGSVISNLPPIEVLSEDDIASYGAESITELLTALGPQTGSARGRGSGPPIVLINAQRVSGFRELRNIPPEAIIRVEILPEEVALQYGFRPDRRVINFIIKDNYSSLDINGGAGTSTAGGYITTDIGSTYTKISKKSRLNLDVDYETTSTLTEDERDIIQEENTDGPIIVGPIGAQDIGQFRTLLPNSDKLEISGSYNQELSDLTSLSGNLSYTNTDSFSLFGLNNPTLTVPQTNQFNDSGSDLIAQRFFIEPRPLQSTSQSDNFQGGLAINSFLDGWLIASDIDVSYVNSQSQIDQNSDFSLLQQSLLSDDNINIFADIFDPNIGASSFINSSVKTTNIENQNTISGTVLNLPNGEVTTALSAGYSYSRIDSDSDQSGQNINTLLSRNIFSFSSNLDIPITESEVGIGKYLGRISFNGDIGADDVSDFGTLSRYILGLSWEPFDGLSLTFTSINEDVPPSIGLLGNPIIVTPNVPIFDFTQSQTSFVQLTSGGNPNLLAERQRDFNISLNYSPKKIENLNIIVDYSRNRSFDTSNSFPLLTPEIEAAFQDRVVRDVNGTLIALDRTPVVYDRVASERIRYGFTFSKRLGNRRPRGARGPAGARGGPSNGRGSGEGRPTNAQPASSDSSATKAPTGQNSGQNAGQNTGQNTGQNNAASGGARTASAQSAGGRPRGRVPRRPGRFNVSLFHTISLEETILIRPGVQELDLLNGSAIGSNGGAARHLVELEGGIFNNGIGARINGNFRSGTSVDGDILTGSSDLRFGSLATLDFRLFFNIDSRPKLVKALPFLKGSRVSFRVNNVFNAIQNITDSSGDVPINFQRGFIDPRGRFVQFRFRKRF